MKLTRRDLAALGGATLASPALLRRAEAATPRDTLVVVREISSIADWDPAVSQILDVQEINGDLYDRLVGFDPRQANPPLSPMLAESWTITPDGRTFTFTLREGARFQSGNAVTSDDVVFSFRRLLLLDREPASNMLQLGLTRETLDGALRAPDPRHFALALPEVFAPSYVLNLLSAAPFSIVDSRLLRQHEQDGDFGSRWLSRRSGNEPGAGSGPFRIQTYRASDILILERNENYWRFRPAMRRVIFRHVPEAGTQRLLLERNDADVAFNLTAQDVHALRSINGLRIQDFPSRRLIYFGFNTLTKPFDDPRVLKAMKYLIDYHGLESTVMRSLGRVHQNFIPSGWLGAIDDNPYRLDVPRAKALLAEAGLPDGFSFRFTASNRKPEMDLATNFQATAALAGVRVEVQNMPSSQSIPLYRDRRVEALQLSFFGGYGDPHATSSKFAYNPAALPGADPNRRWPSELTWRLGWAPADLSRRVLEATRELDEVRRGQMYEALQRDARAESPFAFMFQAIQVLGLRAGVQNYRWGTRGTDTSFAATTKT